MDEIQKLPALLDEIQSLYSKREKNIKFAISGSSARKLKRLGTNLLAGRAINRHFFPLTLAELEFRPSTEELLRIGCLPGVHMDKAYAIDILEAYTVNYIREEIQQEALVKDTPSFSRFLEVAALMNSQVTNVAGLSRDAGVARQTVQRYFETLTGTLIGFWLPAWRPQAKVREIAHPKFYFFDPGVVRVLSGKIRSPLESADKGALLETYILHELRAWMAIANTGGQLYYYRSPAQVEVDVIWVRGQERIGIEIKSSTQWRSEYGSALKDLLKNKIIQKGFGLYMGIDTLRDGPLFIHPVNSFLKQLSSGKIL